MGLAERTATRATRRPRRTSQASSASTTATLPPTPRTARDHHHRPAPRRPVRIASPLEPGAYALSELTRCVRVLALRATPNARNPARVDRGRGFRHFKGPDCRRQVLVAGSDPLRFGGPDLRLWNWPVSRFPPGSSPSPRSDAVGDTRVSGRDAHRRGYPRAQAGASGRALRLRQVHQVEQRLGGPRLSRGPGCDAH